MKWTDAKAKIDFQLDMTREGALAKIELVRQLQNHLLNEMSVQEVILKQTEEDQAALLSQKTEESFRKFCDYRAVWDERYKIGMSDLNPLTPSPGTTIIEPLI